MRRSSWNGFDFKCLKQRNDYSIQWGQQWTISDAKSYAFGPLLSTLNHSFTGTSETRWKHLVVSESVLFTSIVTMLFTPTNNASVLHLRRRRYIYIGIGPCQSQQEYRRANNSTELESAFNDETRDAHYCVWRQLYFLPVFIDSLKGWYTVYVMILPASIYFLCCFLFTILSLSLSPAVILIFHNETWIKTDGHWSLIGWYSIHQLSASRGFFSPGHPW
jgi:hypothetical protein